MGIRDKVWEVTPHEAISSADLGVSSKNFGVIPKVGSKEWFQDNVNQS